MNKLKLILGNLGLWLNQTVCTLAGKDPRLTISAVCYLQGWERACKVINWLFKDPNHCKTAAFGWDTPETWGGLHRLNRSLW